MRDLVQLYTGLANGGRAEQSARRDREAFEPLADGAILEPARRLAGHRHPVPACGRRRARSPRGIAYKTGTSYGYRDAWSIGYDGRYVLGVWVGRADSGSVPGLAGYVSAAPILFEGFRQIRPRRRTAAAPAGGRVPRRRAATCR